MPLVEPLEVFVTSVESPIDPLKRPILINRDEVLDMFKAYQNLSPLEFDNSVKSLLYKFVQLEDEISVPLICITLDTVLFLSKEGKCDFALTHSLVEDLFEIQTISWCQNFWSYLISRESQIAHNLTGMRSPGTTLIRLCNSLVRRLSKSRDGEFSGQIAMFLARAFPLSEKSGLNMRGTFNVENITLYEADSVEVTDESKMDVDKKPEVELETANNENSEPLEGNTTLVDKDQSLAPSAPILTSTSTPTPTSTPAPSTFSTPAPEDTIYSDFWSLQSILSNPTILFQDENELMAFRRKIRRVIALFKSTDENKFSSNNERKRKRSDNENRKEGKILGTNESSDISQPTLTDTETVFVPKWLTKRELFDLQLKDISFRRSFLVQLYIISDFLLGQSTRAKLKWPKLPASNKSVMFQYNLKSPEGKYFSDLRREIRNLISNSSRSELDNLFEKTLTTTVFRDHNWQYWKLRNCPSFERQPLDQTLYEKVALNMTEKQKSRKKFWNSMGTAALSKAWKIETGLDKLKEPEKYRIPSAEEYYERINKRRKEIKQLNSTDVAVDADTAKDEEKSGQQGGGGALAAEDDETISSLTWRGLRAARDQGLWSKFSSVTKENGFAGLFAEEESGSSVKRDDIADIRMTQTPDFVSSQVNNDLNGEGDREEKSAATVGKERAGETLTKVMTDVITKSEKEPVLESDSAKTDLAPQPLLSETVEKPGASEAAPGSRRQSVESRRQSIETSSRPMSPADDSQEPPSKRRRNSRTKGN